MFVRRHLSYANVVATMALVFAMGGSAIAAKHFLITSTGQISPKVLKALEAKIASKVKPGVAGKEGATGREGAAGKAGAEGKGGPEGKEGLSLLSKAEQETLKTILPFVKFTASGPNGKPTLTISGANLQVDSGSGSTGGPVNGLGNVIIGYDEHGAGVEQGGSNNLVLGEEQAFTAYGGLIGGRENTLKAADSVVLGQANTASGPFSSVSGGKANTASEFDTSVSGGFGNRASGPGSSVSGGEHNTASGGDAAALGGNHNKAEGTASSVSGGFENTASGGTSSVVGGNANLASFFNTAVLGGKKNTASGENSTIYGGLEMTVVGEHEALG